jgi:ATP-dependent DNA ligase
MSLQSRPLPFDDLEWVFELKLDGCRALAVIEHGRAQLLSRNGNPFASFTDLASDLAAKSPKYKSDSAGRRDCLCGQKRQAAISGLAVPPWCPLLLRIRPCGGMDWRTERLVDRKQELRRLLGRVPADSRLKYADHVD